MLIQHADSVSIVAVDGGELLVVKQRRAGADEVTVELPSGKLEPGESPEAAVRRELAEECGLAAGEWRRVGSFWAVPAYSTEFVHVFEARTLSPSLDALDADEDEEIEVARVRLDDALDLLSDAVSVASIALWQRRP